MENIIFHFFFCKLNTENWTLKKGCKGCNQISTQTFCIFLLFKFSSNIGIIKSKSINCNVKFAPNSSNKSVFFNSKKIKIFYSFFPYTLHPAEFCTIFLLFLLKYGFPHFSFCRFFIYLQSILITIRNYKFSVRIKSLKQYFK